MKFLCVPVAVVAAVLAFSAAAFAADAPNRNDLAVQSCKTQQTQLGAAFETTYGTNANKSNAFGKCVSKGVHSAQSTIQNAAATCKAQQSDANFANESYNPDHKTFAQFYGTNANLKNAFGKCVSGHAKQGADAQTQATVNAAKECKGELAAGASTFASRYGSGKNAFGVCVSQHAKSR